MLTDKFGREFHYLRLSVTDVCNFRCQYCLPDGYQCDSNRNFLSLAEIRSLVAGFAALGTSKVRITGGEPTLRKDLPGIIEACRNTAGIEQVALTTNGHRLKQQVEQWQAAGLSHVNVSIDSFDPRMFSAITGKDTLSCILNGIEEALKCDLMVKINAVLMRRYNHAEFDDFLAYVKHNPVSLRLIELMQTGENLRFFKQQHVSALPLKERLLAQGWQPCERKINAGPAQEFWHPDYLGRIGLIMPYGPEFCASCNRLRVSATGKLHLCLFAEQGLDIREAINHSDPLVLQARLENLLADKQATHWLKEGFTGATRHLAMLGG